jgi:hypothetical protein
MSRLLKQTGRFAALSFFLLIGLILIHINLGLFYAPSYSSDGIDKGQLENLRSLKTSIREDAPSKMQAIYPEGYFFMHVMYGLSWCEVAASTAQNSDLYKEAIKEIEASDSAISSEKGRRVFSKDLPIPYGVFYTGWSTYLLGKKIGLSGGRKCDSLDLDRFMRNCADIATQFLSDHPVYPESYPGLCWPSDAAVGASCLALYDRVLDTNLYAHILGSWMKRVKKKLHDHALVPHSVMTGSDEVKEGPRGSSTSLMLCFWKEIDTAFAREQFAIYRQRFLDYRFGLPGIREYPKGFEGDGDVDSGPVLLGIGGSASVVGLRTLTLYGEKDAAVGLRNCLETFGCSHSNGKEKFYLFGQLPMADAFIAWANSAACTRQKAPEAGGFWRLEFQLYSLIVLAGCAWGWRSVRRSLAADP